MCGRRSLHSANYSGDYAAWDQKWVGDYHPGYVLVTRNNTQLTPNLVRPLRPTVYVNRKATPFYVSSQNVTFVSPSPPSEEVKLYWEISSIADIYAGFGSITLAWVGQLLPKGSDWNNVFDFQQSWEFTIGDLGVVLLSVPIVRQLIVPNDLNYHGMVHVVVTQGLKFLRKKANTPLFSLTIKGFVRRKNDDARLDDGSQIQQDLTATVDKEDGVVSLVDFDP